MDTIDNEKFKEILRKNGVQPVNPTAPGADWFSQLDIKMY
jgi:hypothetical protein